MNTLLVRGLAALCLIGLTTISEAQYRIDTIAGQTAPVNVPPTGTFLQAPQGLAFDAQGDLYIVQVNSSILSMVSATTGDISTVAGTGISYFSAGFGGPADSAAFQAMRYVAFDRAGNIFLTEWTACTIDRIDAVTKIVTVYAGISGSCGYSGDGGPATGAQLSANTRTIALDSGGNLYIADTNNNRVRRVDATTHLITTYAGGGNEGDGSPIPATSIRFRPFALAFDQSGNLYIGAQTLIHIVDTTTGLIKRFAGAGPSGPIVENVPAAGAAIGSVRGIAFDSAGNLYFNDEVNFRVRKIDTSAQHLVTTVAGNGQNGYSGDGGPAAGATFTSLEGIAIDPAGGIYVSDFTAHVIRKIAGTTISTYAGSLGPDNTAPTAAFLNFPQDVALDASGNILVSDADDARIRRINAALTDIQSIAGVGYAANSGNGGPAVNAGLGYSVQGVVVDSLGNIYIADDQNFEVRKIDGSGNITAFAGNGTQGYSGDGGAATAAQLAGPVALAVDSAGNVYIADFLNNNIRKVDPTGQISTIAGTGAPGFSPDGTPALSAQLNTPNALAFDSAGNLYIADYGNSLVRVIHASDGKIYTFAGNGTAGFRGDGQAAVAAELNGPQGLAVNANGDVFIADGGNSAIRLVTAATGSIQTIAGNGTVGYSGDGGIASQAQLHNPIGIALDAGGRLLIVDNGNNVIRRLTPKTTPAISWNVPAPIVYGTALSSAQLNASTDVAGTFTYTPSPGTVLPAGPQALSVIFTPADTLDFAPSTASTTIVVNKAVLTVSADNVSRPFGTANPAFTSSVTGFVNNDPATVVSGSPALSTNATPASLPGAYPITVALGTLAASNYSFNPVGGTLTVTATASAPSSGSSCNGAYTGTFNGNLTVSAGQNCIFVSGGVSGNIQTSGGSLNLIQAQVGGNVQITGGTFMIGPGSSINGNLQIQGIPASSATNQVCGSTIQRNLQFQNNGSAVLIGSAAPDVCGGNRIGGNLTVQNNTAPVTLIGNTVSGNLQDQNNSSATIVDDNAVTGDLQDQNNTAPTQVFSNRVVGNLRCNSNSSISGGGNTAKSKQGQCSAF